MATGTVSTPAAVVECPAGVWTPIAVGTTISSVGLQVAGSAGVRIAVATSLPAPTVIGGGPLLGLDTPTALLTLDAADIVYGQGLGPAGSSGFVRLYTTTR